MDPRLYYHISVSSDVLIVANIFFTVPYEYYVIEEEAAINQGYVAGLSG